MNKKIVCIIVVILIVVSTIVLWLVNRDEVHSIDEPAISVNGEIYSGSIVNYFVKKCAVDIVRESSLEIKEKLENVQSSDEYYDIIEEELENFEWSAQDMGLFEHNLGMKRWSDRLMEDVKHEFTCWGAMLYELDRIDIELPQEEEERLTRLYEGRTDYVDWALDYWDIEDVDDLIDIELDYELLGYARSEINDNFEEYYDDFEEFYAFKSDECANVRYINLRNYYHDGDASEIAYDVYDKIQEGKDFYRMMERYHEGSDSGKSVYYIESAKEDFEKIASALNIGEVSEPIEVQGGYMIIMRIPGYDEVENKVIEEAKVVLNKEFKNKILTL